MWWQSSSGRIELNITKKQAAICAHSGRNDDDVAYLLTLPAIKRQVAKIDSQALADELREYGAWDDGELADRAANEARLVWVACWDIIEGNL